ncbi:MAG: hypothetical protein FWH27_00730 [Planctomycetaceae bacterium]|nr:hypothetical protein [Planctomycetaceae bacterium]
MEQGQPGAGIREAAKIIRTKVHMTTLTIELLNPDAKRILEELEHVGLIAISEAKPRNVSHRVMELKGLGEEIWKDESVGDYINKERESWDF